MDVYLQIVHRAQLHHLNRFTTPRYPTVMAQDWDVILEWLYKVGYNNEWRTIDINGITVHDWKN